MDETTYRLADTALKLGTAVLGLIGAGIAIFQYRASQTLERAKLEVERRTLSFNLSKQKADLLAEAAQVAATVATSKDPSIVQQAIDRFWQLYFGPLLLVEGEAVESKMVALGELLEQYRGFQGAYGDVQRGPLQTAALHLGQACREEIVSYND